MSNYIAITHFTSSIYDVLANYSVRMVCSSTNQIHFMNDKVRLYVRELHPSKGDTPPTETKKLFFLCFHVALRRYDVYIEIVRSSLTDAAITQLRQLSV